MSRCSTTATRSVMSCDACRKVLSFPLNSTVGLTVVHDPRVYRLRAGTTVSAMRTWDSHHFDQLGSNALCGAMPDARRNPDPLPSPPSSSSLTTFPTTYAFCTPAYVVLSGGRWAARVCIIVAAVRWHRIMMSGGVQPKMNTHGPCLPTTSTPSTQPYV
jgi:hypothetical protein